MPNSIIDRTIGFPLGSTAETETAFTEPIGKGFYSYARRENPTVVSCEQALAKIELAEKCLLTTCGMAAINVSYSIFNDPNDHRPWIFPDNSYSGTIEYAEKILRNQRGTNVIIANSKIKNSSNRYFFIIINLVFFRKLFSRNSGFTLSLYNFFAI
jgi:cystathionine beta-lyase/cystathionine gamma-synthase